MAMRSVSYVILGMLYLGPRSGYDIKRFVDQSTRFFWAASYGQIYPELTRLAKAGLIESERAPEGGRRRTVYRLTPAGEARLREWLVSGEEPVHELRDEGLLRLFFADAVTPEDALRIVRTIRRRETGVLERLRDVEPKARAGPARFPALVLECGLSFHSAIVAWCDETEHRLLERAE
jgi:PadR family transcriptional regulator AphA